MKIKENSLRDILQTALISLLFIGFTAGAALGATYTVGDNGVTWAGNSIKVNVTEDMGDHDIKIGVFADNFNDNDYIGWDKNNSGTLDASTGALNQSINTSVPGGEEIWARPTNFQYSQPAAILAKVNVTNYHNTFAVEGLAWDDNSWDSNTNIWAGWRDTTNNWRLYVDASANNGNPVQVVPGTYTGNVTSNVKLERRSNSVNYTSSYNNIALNNTTIRTDAYPYLYGSTNNSTTMTQYWDDVRIVPLDANDAIVTTGNLTAWYNAGSENNISQLYVNVSILSGTNYSVQYCQNGTGSFVTVGGTRTGNSSITLSPAYNNTDVRVVLNGTDTQTPAVIAITFISEAAGGPGPKPIIDTWYNNKTEDNATSLTLNSTDSVRFNATANQTITTWKWLKNGMDMGINTNNVTTNFSISGTLEVNATNANGSASKTWTITVSGSPITTTNITSWSNNKTNTTDLNLTLGINESIRFNATANMKIDQWTWFRDGENMSINFDNFTTSFNNTLPHTIMVNATNLSNGTASKTWNINPSPPPTPTNLINITDWRNSKTNNSATSLTLSLNESVRFNATANQTVSTWNWFKDGIKESNNTVANYTTSFNTTGTHTVVVNATNATNVTSNSINWTITVAAAPDYILPLTKGWNLVSVPFSLSNTTPFAGYDVRYYNASLKIPEIPSAIEPLKSYWVNTSNATNISLYKASGGGGVGEPPSKSIALKNGWNMVGHTGLETNVNASEMFGSIYLHLWRAATYNQTGNTYVIYTNSANANNKVSDLKTNPSVGYWVFVTMDSMYDGDGSVK